MNNKIAKKHGARVSFRDSGLTIFSLIFVTVYAMCCILPFLYVFFVSFMSYNEYLSAPDRIIPHHFVLTAYKEMLGYTLIRTGYEVTLFITIFGTILSVILLVVTAYPLSKNNLKGHGFFMGLIMFTMFFGGGMIPDYILVKNLGMKDTIWALIFPGCMNAFYIILMKNFIKTSIPDSLEETARIEGASYTRILISIIFPLMTPAIATMVVFCSVGYWNNYFSAMLYITNRDLWPLSLVLREIVVQQDTSAISSVAQMLNSQVQSHPFTLRMAAIIITIVPILLVYPYMQKYFVKGIMLGSVKG